MEVQGSKAPKSVPRASLESGQLPVPVPVVEPKRLGLMSAAQLTEAGSELLSAELLGAPASVPVPAPVPVLEQLPQVAQWETAEFS